MEWNVNNILLLIEEYKRHGCLWDPKDPHYKFGMKKNDAWQEIADALEISTEDAKKKMASLLSSFRRERGKVDTPGRMHAGKKYRSRWFAFEPMSFLLEKVKLRKRRSKEIINTCEEVDEDETTQDVIEDEGMSELVVSQVVSASEETHEDDVEQLSEPPRKKNRHVNGDEYDTAGTLNVIKALSDNVRKIRSKEETKSPCDFFGDYVASKLKTYDSHVLNIVQFKIHEVLFQADMGNYNSTSDIIQQAEFIQVSPSSPIIKKSAEHSDNMVQSPTL